MKGRLHEMALALMQRAFAVKQAFPKKLLGHVPAAALQKGAVLPDEHLMDVLRMAEEHGAFRTEPEGDDITILTLEAAHKAQHVTRESQQMGPGKAGPGAGRRRCGDHTQSFYVGAAPREGVASPRCGRHMASLDVSAEHRGSNGKCIQRVLGPELPRPPQARYTVSHLPIPLSASGHAVPPAHCDFR